MGQWLSTLGALPSVISGPPQQAVRFVLPLHALSSVDIMCSWTCHHRAPAKGTLSLSEVTTDLLRPPGTSTPLQTDLEPDPARAALPRMGRTLALMVLTTT